MGARHTRIEAVLGAVALAFVTACGKPAARGGFPPAEVSIVTVTPQSVPVSYEFSAQVVPYRRVEVRSRVEGLILERPFVEGQIVHPGDVLYRLETVKYDAAPDAGRFV